MACKIRQECWNNNDILTPFSLIWGRIAVIFIITVSALLFLFFFFSYVKFNPSYHGCVICLSLFSTRFHHSPLIKGPSNMMTKTFWIYNYYYPDFAFMQFSIPPSSLPFRVSMSSFIYPEKREQ